jgi:hypothetical protein
MVPCDEADEKTDETGEGGCEYDEYDDDERLKERDKVGDEVR